jgi:hypothetical protein
VASIFCSQTAPDFVQFECGAELGGIVSVIFIDPDQPTYTKTDLQTRSFWTSKINATPNVWWVVKETRGTYAGGTPVEEDGYGKTPTLRTGADHEMTFEVRGVLNNAQFWSIISQNAKWNMIFITNGNVGHYVQDVSSYAKYMIDQNIKSTERVMVSNKWSDDLSNPLLFDATAMVDLFTI